MPAKAIRKSTDKDNVKVIKEWLQHDAMLNRMKNNGFSTPSIPKIPIPYATTNKKFRDDLDVYINRLNISNEAKKEYENWKSDTFGGYSKIYANYPRQAPKLVNKRSVTKMTRGKYQLKPPEETWINTPDGPQLALFPHVIEYTDDPNHPRRWYPSEPPKELPYWAKPIPIPENPWKPSPPSKPPESQLNQTSPKSATNQTSPIPSVSDSSATSVAKNPFSFQPRKNPYTFTDVINSFLNRNMMTSNKNPRQTTNAYNNFFADSAMFGEPRSPRKARNLFNASTMLPRLSKKMSKRAIPTQRTEYTRNKYGI